MVQYPHMDQVAQIREKVDVVGLIAEYIPLKRAGRNFNARCPFHNEKTPSFVISAEKQMWHCFGCGKGGDAFTFLMEYENLEFVEALRLLAKKTGIELAASEFDRNATSKKELIYKINKVASEFYQYVLKKHPVGKKALEYLYTERQLNEGIINTFMLGYAPKTGNALSQYLIQKKKYHQQDLVDAGLSYIRGGRVVDFFIDRVIFPLTDHRGNILGFSGRIMDPKAEVAKYVNTRETYVYHKGSVFFGLDTAKEEIKKEGKAIVVEGEFDVISSYENSIKNVVAVKGTALTETQVNLLSRFTNKIALCFDQDRAGKEAVKRSLATLEKKGLTTTVIVPPTGKDADEAIKKDVYGFKKAIQNDIGVYDYLLEKTITEFSSSSVEGKQKISEELLPLFALIENEIVKEHYLRKLSNELSTSYESILKQIEKIQKKEVNTIQAAVINKEKKDRQEMLEEYLVALLVQHQSPRLLFDKVDTSFSEIVFKISSYKKIIEMLYQYILKFDSYDHKNFEKQLPSELQAPFNTCFLYPLSQLDTDKEYIAETKKTLIELKTHYIKSKVKKISEEIRQKEKEGNTEEIEALQKELMSLTTQLK